MVTSKSISSNHRVGDAERKVFVQMFSDIVMSSKTVSNKSGFWALIAIFVGQGILVGLIVIVLGLTKALDPFVLTSYEYGLVIEGVYSLLLAS